MKPYFEHFQDPAPAELGRQISGAEIAASAADAALLGAIGRLEGVLEEETAALHRSAPADFAEFARIKCRCLLELTRMGRTVAGAGDEGLRTRLTALRAKLDANCRLLGLHLTAVQEIAEFLSQSLGDANSDGTYSPGKFVPAGRR